MPYLNFFYNKYVRLYQVTKFEYTGLLKNSFLKNINLQFNLTKRKNLLVELVVLQLLSNYTIRLQSNNFWNKQEQKAKKSSCELKLASQTLFYFLEKLILIYLGGKNSQDIERINVSNLSLNIEDFSMFTELNSQFTYFTHLKNLNVSFLFSKKNKFENLLVLKLLSLQLS